MCKNNLRHILAFVGNWDIYIANSDNSSPAPSGSTFIQMK